MPTSYDEIAWPIRTARLTLRRARPDDLDDLWRIAAKDGVDEWIKTAAVDRRAFAERMGERSHLDHLIVVELEHELIGYASVEVGDAWAQTEVAAQAVGVEAELGWVFDPDAGGQGYATEVVRELLWLCFDGLGLRRVVAHCFADNAASWRLMERVGMRRESFTVKDSLHRSGVWLDGMSYAILADEWRASLT